MASLLASLVKRSGARWLRSDLDFSYSSVQAKVLYMPEGYKSFHRWLQVSIAELVIVAPLLVIVWWVSTRPAVEIRHYPADFNPQGVSVMYPDGAEHRRTRSASEKTIRCTTGYLMLFVGIVFSRRILNNRDRDAIE